MNQIKSHLDLELSREKPNLYLVAQLRGVLSSGSLSFEKWKDSGMFTPLSEFKQKYPDVKLHADCSNVIEYIGMYFIQGFKDGTFYYDDVLQSLILDSVEESVWDIFVDKKINN